MKFCNQDISKTITAASAHRRLSVYYLVKFLKKVIIFFRAIALCKSGHWKLELNISEHLLMKFKKNTVIALRIFGH